MLTRKYWNSLWRGAARYAALGRVGVRYVNGRKIANILRCETEKRRRLASVRSFPYVAVLDVTNLCNLRCPYCPTGARRDAGRKQRTMPLEMVDRLLDEIGDYLVSVNLFNWGEPLLHPQIAEIVGRFHTRRIFTHLSSNLSLDNKPVLEAVCEAGLDYLMVSTSGASPEISALYHRNSSISIVADNVRFITTLKRRHRRRTPIVEWKYLMFKHNAHEIAAAQALAADAGADVFRVVRGGGEQSALVGDQEAPPSSLPTKLCHQLWHMVVVSSDGGIAPCCYLYFKPDDFGGLSQASVMETRNNSRYVTARRLFDPAALDSLPADLQHPCLKCELVHRVPHLRAYLASNPHARKQPRTGGP